MPYITVAAGEQVRRTRGDHVGEGLLRLVSDLKLRRRTRLKNKQSKQLRDDLDALVGAKQLWQDSDAVETAELGEIGVILVNNHIVGFTGEAGPFVSIRGALQYGPSRRYVTVDMGAVRFVTNGADIMAPGITDADPDLQPGDWCWIRDENNQRPLAIGKCITSGPEMTAADKGKAVAMVHHIGDKIWELESR